MAFLHEQSAGAVIFYTGKDGTTKYLLLHYAAGHWDFPKGHLEEGETKKEAAIREIREETGLTQLNFIRGFMRSFAYYFKPSFASYKTLLPEERAASVVRKEVTFYLAEAFTAKVVISSEHTGFKWLPYAEAVNVTTFKNAKKLLDAADNYLRIQYPRSLQKKVLDVVATIPPGDTMSYREVAEKVGNAKLSRAVGSILAENYDPHVPCHRVIKHNGEAGQYNRGVEKKKELLQRENRKRHSVRSTAHKQ